MKFFERTICILVLVCCVLTAFSQKSKVKKQTEVIGYFGGRASMIDSFPLEKLTQVIFSFTHLKGNRMSIGNARDSAALQKLVNYKKTKYPALKVIVSLGGWTGCYTCSDVFKSDSARKEFAGSVKQVLNDFAADGFDLDWEYPVIKGPPGHPYAPQDKEDLTLLMKTLRDSLGKEKQLSFAAGGFTKFIEESVDWKKVIRYVDRVNLMTYDLITGYDTITGHHTALYSNPLQKESTDNAVRMLIKRHVPAKKLVIGAAFYARIWEQVPAVNNGLYQPGKFMGSISYRNFETKFSADSGYIYHWDPTSKAPYYYNPLKKWFVTFDDSTSIRLKTAYAIKKHLNGIMFWQLADDRFFENGLLDEIYRKKTEATK